MEIAIGGACISWHRLHAKKSTSTTASYYFSCPRIHRTTPAMTKRWTPPRPSSATSVALAQRPLALTKWHSSHRTETTDSHHPLCSHNQCSATPPQAGFPRSRQQRPTLLSADPCARRYLRPLPQLPPAPPPQPQSRRSRNCSCSPSPLSCPPWEVGAE